MQRKILFLSQSHSIGGGVERWLADLIAGLAQAGHEITLGLAHGSRFHDARRYQAAFPELAGVRTVALDGFSGVSHGRRAAMETLIRQVRPDVLVPVLLHEGLGAGAKLRAQGLAHKIIYPVHEQGIWVMNAVREYADQIDAIVSVNRLMLAAFERMLGWPANRAFHVPAGVRSAQRVCTAPASRMPLQLGYCGRLTQEQKRVSDVFAFCAELDRRTVPYRLSIVGSGSFEPALRMQFHDHVADGRVRFLGQYSNEQLYSEFYPSLDAIVITSEWETGPLVAWEAMSHGVLIVSSAYRGLVAEGILRPGVNALAFPVGQPEAGARILGELAQDPRRWQTIASAGQACARETLSLNAMIAGWLAAIEGTISLPAVAPRSGHFYAWATGVEQLRGRIMDSARRILRRPIYHANSHAEWPRYPPGHVTKEECAPFDNFLDALDKAC
jgi:glycosyltransferase involved in cell wall biosynthesis